MAKLFNRVTKADKSGIISALAAEGIKARVRVSAHSSRICFAGNQDAVLAVLNREGFRNAAGQLFSWNSFNQPHEIFIHLKAPA